MRIDVTFQEAWSAWKSREPFISQGSLGLNLDLANGGQADGHAFFRPNQQVGRSRFTESSFDPATRHNLAVSCREAHD